MPTHLGGGSTDRRPSPLLSPLPGIAISFCSCRGYRCRHENGSGKYRATRTHLASTWILSNACCDRQSLPFLLLFRASTTYCQSRYLNPPHPSCPKRATDKHNCQLSMLEYVTNPRSCHLSSQSRKPLSPLSRGAPPRLRSKRIPNAS